MDISTLNQIIETSGLILSPLIAIVLAYIFSKKLIRTKSNVQREINYLKGALFLYEVILSYKKEVQINNKSSLYNTFRNEAESALGYKPDEIFSPSSIRKRLSELGELSTDIDNAIEKVKKI